MNIYDFWSAVLEQDAERIKQYFHPDAYVNWHCTNERFTVDEFIKANCEYGGDGASVGAWDGKIEKIFTLDNKIITVTNVFPKDRSSSFHVTSIFEISENMISSVDEYWADDGEAPKWRRDMNIGRSIK